MFTIGQRVRLKVSKREGVVAAIFEGSFAPGLKEENSYLIELDGGVGTSTITEDGLEEIGAARFWQPVCECGLKFSMSGGRHSSWCPIKEE